jgi:hypothetical protein
VLQIEDPQIIELAVVAVCAAKNVEPLVEAGGAVQEARRGATARQQQPVGHESLGIHL